MLQYKKMVGRRPTISDRPTNTAYFVMSAEQDSAPDEVRPAQHTHLRRAARGNIADAPIICLTPHVLLRRIDAPKNCFCRLLAQFAEIELERSFRGESWVKWFRRAIKRIFRNEESRLRRKQEQQHSSALPNQQPDSVAAVNALLDAVAENNTNMVLYTRDNLGRHRQG